jgi:hypothetical protein
MAGRRTNLALLWATIIALATGVAAFTVGTASGSWVIIAHGVFSFAIVILSPWKSMIAVRGVTRERSGRALSIGLSLAVVAALSSGVLLITGAVDHIGPFTTMQLHVSFGLLTVALTLIHTLQRPVRHRSADLSRRNALRAGSVLAAAGGLWLIVEGMLDVTEAKGGDRRFTGSHEISDPGDIPATQWINDRVQHIDATIHVVSLPKAEIPVAELDVGDSIEATLDCTGGWYSTQVWTGTRLDRLIDRASGTSIVVRSTTGYWRRFPIEHTGDLLLATRVAGDPLPDGNGGPVRLVAPGRRGYWWVKWVERVEVDDRPPWWQPPLPLA